MLHLFNLHNDGVKRKKGFTVCGCVGPGRERVREGKRKRGRVCKWAWGGGGG